MYRLFNLNKFLIVVFLFLLQIDAGSAASSKDANVKTLPNGLEYYSLPSSNSEKTSITIYVWGGQLVESRETIGVAHLLEHLLFRNVVQVDGKTFNTHLKDMGGRFNAEVTTNYTRYYLTVSKKFGKKSLDLLSQMIQTPVSDKLDINLAKKAIAIELGEPSFSSSLLGIDLMGNVESFYFRRPSFKESEFNRPLFLYPKDDELIVTKGLKHKDINEYHSQFYVPSNMSLLVSGYISDELNRFVIDEFGSIKQPSNIEEREKLARSVYRSGQYIKSSETEDGSPIVEMGIKLYNLTPEELNSLYLLFYYAQDFLEDSLRSARGDSYSPSLDWYYKGDWGYITLSVDVAPGMQETIKDEMSKLIFEDLATISNEDFLDTKKRIKSMNESYSSFDSVKLMKILDSVMDHNMSFGSFDKEKFGLEELDLSTVREVAMNRITENNKYLMISQGSYFWDFEQLIIAMFCMFFAVFFFKFLATHFNESAAGLTYRGRVFSKLIDPSILIFSAVGTYCTHWIITKPIQYTYFEFSFIQKSYFYSFILSYAIQGCVWGGVFVMFLNFFPKKILQDKNDVLIFGYGGRMKKISCEYVTEKSYREYISENKMRILNLKLLVMIALNPFCNRLELKSKSGDKRMLPYSANR